MGRLALEIARIARDQHGVVSRQQLRELGCVGSTLHRRVAGGLLVPCSGAFVLLGAPPTFEQRCLAAVLGAGRGARASYRTAAFLHGFDRFREPARIEITIPSDRRLRRAGLRVHTTVAFRRGDLATVAGIPVTSPARTVIDLAGVADRSDLEAAVDSALRDRTASGADLFRRLRRLEATYGRGARLLRAVLEGRPAGGLHSELERAFYALVRDAGLPLPVTQAVHRNRGGRIIRVDFLFPEHDLVVEVDGHATHATRQQRRADARRKRVLVSEGRRVVEFTGDEVFGQPDHVVGELVILLRPRAA